MEYYTDSVDEIEELANWVNEQKEKKKVVVATCGCFSILHPEHLLLLKLAKCQGDFLIVGLNDDEYIRSVKGYSVFFSQEERKNLISEFRCVDKVFIFSDKNFGEILKLLRPNIFVKGVDYKSNLNEYEQAVCAQYGIRFMPLGTEKNYSASAIIKSVEGTNDKSSVFGS